ncbi:esterase/lipase family protein [Mycolicibacterium conceptionense]|nr:alpha/beta fold hydrolase [Mycolicibacterium conceptionense]
MLNRLPRLVMAAVTAAAALVVPLAAPAAADPPRCTPSTEHPYPVVLLHGTFSNRDVWKSLRPKLDSAGYCTYVVEYGHDESSTMGNQPGVYGTAPVTASVEQVAMQVRKVFELTGAAKVSLVTHSQGGLIARLLTTRAGGGAEKVDTVVSLAGTQNGTTALGVSEAADALGISVDSPAGEAAAKVAGQAAVDQLTNSPLMQVLHQEANTAKGVRYLSVYTDDDTVATPAAQAGAWDTDGPAKAVWNVNVRECLRPNTPVGHSAIVDLPATEHLTLWALGHGEGTRPHC